MLTKYEFESNKTRIINGQEPYYTTQSLSEKEQVNKYLDILQKLKCGKIKPLYLEMILEREDSSKYYAQFVLGPICATKIVEMALESKSFK